MSMILKDPFDALVPLREAMSRLFEDSFVWPKLPRRCLRDERSAWIRRWGITALFDGGMNGAHIA